MGQKFTFARKPSRKASLYEIENLEDKVNSLSKSLDHAQRLRRVENLSATNFEQFLIENEPLVMFTSDGQSFFPCTSSITNSSRGVGKFARQWG